MGNYAYVTTLKNVHAHPNADRLQLGDCFGNQVIVSLDYYEGQLGIYFAEGAQLSEEFCRVHDLVRRKDEGGNPAGGYLDPNKRNIKAVKLRGQVSDGFFMPISCLESFGDTSALIVGDIVDTFNGVEICKKYIPRQNPSSSHPYKASTHRKKKIFPAHIDTPQLRFCIDKFKAGDFITITEKLEGTSFRAALLPIKKTNFFRKLFHLPPKTIYKDYCGSRRVIINEAKGNDGFYGTNAFRLDVHKQIVPHLSPNMEVFGEIVGWPAPDMAPLMGEVDTKCVNDKAFTKKYGEKMIFHYGCQSGMYDFYIYRICELDEDGDVRIEYSTDQIKDWCEKCGFKYVPILWRGVLEKTEDIEQLAATYCDGESALANHWREGCVIRRENNAYKFDVYKNKNNYYKIMKGLFVEQLNGDEVSAELLEEM